MERTGRAPERRLDETRTLTGGELAAFEAAYARARKDAPPTRGRASEEVRAAQEARRAFLETVSRELGV